MYVFGFCVFVMVGIVDKCCVCEVFGVECVINYKIEDFVEVVKLLMYDCGVDVIFDMVVGLYVLCELFVFVDGGCFVLIVLFGGVKVDVNFGEILCCWLMIIGLMLCLCLVEFKVCIVV